MAERAAETIRLVIVDDHAIVRQGLRSILEREPDIEVVGEAASAGEALDLVAASRPHIVLLDLKLSAGSDVAGLALCGQLTAATPAPGVLVVTTFLDQQLVLEAIQRGARGSMGPKVEAALRFVEGSAPGPGPTRRAVVTSLEHIADAVTSDDVGTVLQKDPPAPRHSQARGGPLHEGHTRP